MSPVLNHPGWPSTTKNDSSLALPLFSYPPKQGGPRTKMFPLAPTGTTLTPPPSTTWSTSAILISGPTAMPEVPVGSKRYVWGGEEMGMHSVMP